MELHNTENKFSKTVELQNTENKFSKIVEFPCIKKIIITSDSMPLEIGVHNLRITLNQNHTTYIHMTIITMENAAN